GMWGSEAAPNLAEAREVGCVPGVIDGMGSGLQHEAAVTAMRIFQNASAPVPRGDMGNGQITVARSLPPIKLDDFRKAEIGDQIRNVTWNDDGGGNAADTQVVLHDGAQRRTMEMIEVSMRNQHYVDGREIGDAQAWTAEALQHEEPAREVRIDDYAPAANLYEEAGMADESDAQFSVRGKARHASLATARSYRRVAH